MIFKHVTANPFRVGPAVAAGRARGREEPRRAEERGP